MSKNPEPHYWNLWNTSDWTCWAEQVQKAGGHMVRLRYGHTDLKLAKGR